MSFQPLALITGASSGIGRACAESLAQQGYDLILLARREAQLIETQNLCLKLNSKIKVRYFCVDLTDDLAVDQFVAKVDLSKVTVLINNTGLAKGTEPVQKAAFQDWDAMLKTNVRALFYLTHKILPLMTKNRSGHIVNIGSVAGRWVYPGGAVYCATKFAIRAFTEGLRQDLVGTGLRVTNIEPGMVHTNFSNVRFNDAEKAKKVYEGMTPLTAHDIAESVVWSLLRPAHVNIQELVIFPTDQAAIGLVHRQ